MPGRRNPACEHVAEVADVPVDVFSGVDTILKQEGVELDHTSRPRHVGALVDLRTRTRPHPRRGATLGFGEKRQQRRWEVAAAADAEGRRDLRRDAREGGEWDGREDGSRVCWPIYTSTDRSESLDRRWTVG